MLTKSITFTYTAADTYIDLNPDMIFYPNGKYQIVNYNYATNDPTAGDGISEGIWSGSFDEVELFTLSFELLQFGANLSDGIFQLLCKYCKFITVSTYLKRTGIHFFHTGFDMTFLFLKSAYLIDD